MAAVSQAFHETPDRQGLVIGILPSDAASIRPKAGYPNPWVEIPICTHLPLSGAQGGELRSRNHINVLSSDVIIALPGGAGTSSEVALALAYERPVVCHLDSRDDIPGLPAEASVCHRFEALQEIVKKRLEERRS